MEKLRKNYFYLGTVLYLIIILLCFAVFNEGIDKLVLKDGMWNTIVHTFRFDNKDQLILNILPFVVVSLSDNVATMYGLIPTFPYTIL